LTALDGTLYNKKGDFAMGSFDRIAQYLRYLVDSRGLQLCIKDFCGFIPINKELDKALQPFLAHTNPFCMYIKQDLEKYRDCISLIKKIYNKSEQKRDCFYGVCHAGLGEYVVPITCNDLVIGSINIGFFQTNETRTEYLIRRCCSASDLLHEEKALKLYKQHILPPCSQPDEFLVGIQLVAEYLGNTYQAIQNTHWQQSPERIRYNSEDTIITHALEYIRQHYSSRISVAELAEFCHCSESYISHIFKRRTGLNINVYINKVRVELSKNYLLLTENTIAEISLSLGFNDPNYFSRVFTELIGHSPREFRQRFKDNAQVIASLPEELNHPIIQ
jgi:AraC-like DNA-binding protein